MNYNELPSLHHMAIIQIAIELWKQTDINHLFKCHLYRIVERRKEIEEELSNKINKLSLPELLKTGIQDVIKPIGLQIIKWVEYHNQHFFLGTNCSAANFIKNLCWTPQGMINYRKTAEFLVNNQNIHVYIKYRYQLACTYCCENHIPTLLNELPKELANFFNSDASLYFTNPYQISAFWTYCTKGEIAKLNNLAKSDDPNASPFEYIFLTSVKNHNDVAAQFFWQKLTVEEKTRNVVNTAKFTAQDGAINILCFLLSQMSKDQQMEVFKDHAFRILKCLLDWPWRDFFVMTATHVWHFLSEENYIGLQSLLVKRIKDNLPGNKYQKLLRELWWHSPPNFKKYTIENIWIFLSELFDSEDIESIKLILKDATAEEKYQIIHSIRGINTCTKLIRKNKFELLDIFMVETLSIEDKISNFKKDLAYKEGGRICAYLVYDNKWQLIEKLLSWFFSSEEEISNFKKQLPYTGKSDICFQLMRRITNLKNPDEWHLVDGFLSHWFSSEVEINKFKNEELIGNKKGETICVSLIYENKLKLADTFLTWYFPSKEEIIQFKRELMLSNTGLEVYKTFIGTDRFHSEFENMFDKQKLFARLIKWYEPSEQTLVEFKLKFKKHAAGLGESCNTLHNLLDKFVPESTTDEVVMAQENEREG